MLVIQMEVTDVAGAVVVIHNFPRESELGAAFGGLEVANVLVLGICRNTRKGTGCLDCLLIRYLLHK